MGRRGWLLLVGGCGLGIAVHLLIRSRTGTVARRFGWRQDGSCSFCGQASPSAALVGVPGRLARICGHDAALSVLVFADERAADRQTKTCSFCEARAPGVSVVVGTKHVRGEAPATICEECATEADAMFGEVQSRDVGDPSA